MPLPETRAQNVPWNERAGVSAHDQLPRVNGSLPDILGRTPTTDEIVQWAACKHGLDPNLARAQAMQESGWQVDRAYGDFSYDPAHCHPDYPIGWDPPEIEFNPPDSCPESFGLTQVRYRFDAAAFENDNAILSTAYNADYAWGLWRLCFNGPGSGNPLDFAWLNTVERGSQYAAGDALGCMGVWYSGRWHTAAANDYIARVHAIYLNKSWPGTGGK